MVKITEEQKNTAEIEIRENEKIYNYRTTQWELQHICSIFWNGNGNFSEWELFIPSYQRDYVWSDSLKWKFIESLFLNIPIPYIFISEDSIDWWLEVVDWYQRIRTIYEFINDWFKLKELEKLCVLKWFKFSDLPIVRQKLFKRIVMNVVIFENLEIKQKQEMFSRINTTSEQLNSSEIRKGTIWWEFYKFMKDLSNLPLFIKLCPLSKNKLKREEDIELILRYFAYTESFNEYKGNVDTFLTDFMKKRSIEIDILNKQINELTETDLEKEIKIKIRDDIFINMKDNFINMLNFVDKNFPFWFRKRGRDKIVSSRVYYESISVWVWLSLLEKKDENLDTSIIKLLLKNNNFKIIITSDWANATKKFRARINAVKDALVSSKLPILPE